MTADEIEAMIDIKIRKHFAETDRMIGEMDDRLRVIARQNAKLAEMVEVLGAT